MKTSTTVKKLYFPYLLWASLFLIPLFSLRAQSTLTADGNWHTLDYTGAAVDWMVPASTNYKHIEFEIVGGDGGSSRSIGCDRTAGGGGAIIEAVFRIGNEATQIPLGSTLRCIVGEAGEAALEGGAGGGGGTALISLSDAGDNNHKILAAAGGGGGATTKTNLFACFKDPGGSASVTTSGNNDDNNDFLGGQDGAGGEGTGTFGGGGGGGAISGGSYEGTYYQSDGKKGQWSGGAGGITTFPDRTIFKGGWGFGGGGAGFSHDEGNSQSFSIAGGAGGGGGYSGGAAGGYGGSAGGGGSFVLADIYASAISLMDRTNEERNGYIKYRFVTRCDPEITAVTVAEPNACDSDGARLTTAVKNNEGCSPLTYILYRGSGVDGANIIQTNTTGNFSNVAAGTYTVAVYTQATGIAHIQEVTVQNSADTTPATALCKDVTVNLDVDGNYTLTPDEVDNGSFDDCGISEIGFLQGSIFDPVIVQNLTFSCADVGNTDLTVGLTVFDYNRQGTFCLSKVTVEDNLPPEFTSINCTATVHLDTNGEAMLSLEDFSYSITDNCSTTEELLFIWTDADKIFTCADVDAYNQVGLKARDAAGNWSAFCNTIVYVKDEIAPTVECQDVTVELDDNGQGQLQATDFIVSASDNCRTEQELIDQYSLPLEFQQITCDDLGTHEIGLLRTGNGVDDLPAPCQATLRVVDKGVPTARCRSVSVQADEQGNATISTADIDNGSYDACGEVSLSLDQTELACTEAGPFTVTLTITDAVGNNSHCEAQVTVEDAIAPVALCRDLTVQLDASGQATITAAAADNGSYDSCGDIDFSVDKSSFSCDEVGSNSVILTVTDDNGNWNTCQFTVQVEDTVSPTALCQDVTVQVNAAGLASIEAADVDNGSSDACGQVSLSLDNSVFTCQDENLVTLTVTDPHGNSSNCQAIVFVDDLIAPQISCSDLSVSLSAEGVYELGEEDLTELVSATDNCGSYTRDLVGDPKTVYDCEDAGQTFPITVLVADQAGNTDQCTAHISVVDDTPPVALCKDITIYLDDSGLAYLSGADLDGGSSDACGIASLQASQTEFNCFDVILFGFRSVNLTVTDVAGNTNQCRAQVQIRKDIPPTAICRDLTVQLDESGQVSVDPNMVDNGSYDICVEMERPRLDRSDFTCADIGENIVTLTVSGVFLNEASCQATITVEDNVAPIANCQNVTVHLDASSNASITAADIDNGSTDACGIDDLSLDLLDFSCADLGDNTVHLTVFDLHDNFSTCTATVQVLDVTPPGVSADLVFVSGNHVRATYEVAVDATDECDSAPAIAAVMKLPPLHTPNVGFKVKNKDKITIDLASNQVKVEGKFPQALWARVMEEGGIAVQNEQEIDVKLGMNSGNYQYKFDKNGQLRSIVAPHALLQATATDASGNSAIAEDEIPVEAAGSQLLEESLELENTGNVTTIPDLEIETTVDGYALEVFPNPFQVQTTIRFNLVQPEQVNLGVYNLQGQLVRQITEGNLSAGLHEYKWAGSAQNERPLPPGIYLIRLQVPGHVLTRRVSLLR